MAKVKYNDITFDSDLEVEYYKKISSDPEVLSFTYHPNSIFHILPKRSYTPDFIVVYEDKIEVVETKGFNQFSYREDDNIHEAMKSKNEEFLIDYVEGNNISTKGKKVEYHKYKYLKTYGWVEWGWKNPNTLSNQRKKARDEALAEVKKLNKELKEYKRYLTLKFQDKKPTKVQRQFIDDFEIRFKEENGL